ncbi:MAG: serine protease [Desulfobacterales bacterium]|nr:serine protease [Desulfobacterales bacterium]
MRHIRHIIILILAIFCAAMSGTGSAVTESEQKRIPLPIGETADVLKRWWEDQGYRIQKIESTSGRITLQADKSDAGWAVELVPSSPLATLVTIRYSRENTVTWRQQLWDHLLQYIDTPGVEPSRDTRERVPVVVLSKIESVVCIHARTNGKDIQFSGVIVDREGLVLCTGHDLKTIREVTVTLYDGHQAEGKILFKNSLMDLTLIQLPMKTDTAVNLAEGRNLLGMGEAVFTVGCPVNLRGTIYSGTINGPPRLVNDQPLWQVQMEIYPGSSGSPVFDVNGNLVGMVKGRYRGTSDLGFLIPLETMIRFLKEKNPL